MSKPVDKLLVLRGFADNRHTVFKFAEPASTPKEVLFGGLSDGTYKKAFLVEEYEYRSMCFALNGCTQSEMRIDDPYALVSEYTRQMMAFLAFHPCPDKILIIGLGGGSLAKFCHRHLAATKVTAVEIDPNVLAMRSQFFVPMDDERLTTVQADGAEHLAQMAERGEHTKVILVDAFDHTGIASAVVERSFIENARRVLGMNGVFVINVVAAPADAERYVETIRQVFEECVLVMCMRRDGNLVIVAGKTLHDPQRVNIALRNAERAEHNFGLLFPALVEHLNQVADRGTLGAGHVFG